MASPVPYTVKMLIQRIRKHMADGFPSDDFSISNNEIMLYIDEAVANNLVGLVYNNAKIEGTLELPEGFLLTSTVTLAQDNVTGYWKGALPQAPISLPLGYSINRAYFASSANGVGTEVLLIKAKRVGYRKLLPKPTGISGWVEGSTIILEANDGGSLANQTLYVQMPVARTQDVNAPINMPDDIITKVFDSVITKLKDRYSEPKDIVKDYLPAGNKEV
jgi:hypothetical protein